jgi:uncharacterized phiE125 gp8 family phage protein
MNTIRITDATVEPLTLAQAKTHLRETLSNVDNDAYITSLITTARQAAENEIHRSLLQTTWLLTLDAFPAKFELQRPPLISVDWVKYIDTDGDLQTMDAADYLVTAGKEPGEIAPVYGTSWPASRCQAGAITVQFKAGYGTTADKVPGPIVQWIKLAIGELYANRSASAQKPALPQDFAAALLDGYRFERF